MLCRVALRSQNDTAPSWLDSSVGRALRVYSATRHNIHINMQTVSLILTNTKQVFSIERYSLLFRRRQRSKVETCKGSFSPVFLNPSVCKVVIIVN